MYKIVLRITFAIMMAFAYLLLSVTFYQNAMAQEVGDEDCNAFSVCSMRLLLEDEDSKWAVAMSTQMIIAGILNAEALGVSYEAGDRAIYDVVFNRLALCAFDEDATYLEVAMRIAWSANDPTASWPSTVYLYYVSRCAAEVAKLHSPDGGK